CKEDKRVEEVLTGAPVRAATATDTVAFVALSRFTVANEMTREVKQAFLERPHLVDKAPGFLRLEVLTPLENPDEIWLFTYWTDEQSFKVWHHSHLYHESHKAIPKGLKLVPKSASLRYFEHVCS
ncbi:MAG TPA: antibiotic biosynthesis monooxygenase, partial [Pyrinomonadaceae bacterium]|nr:antibiotic biosynthesis monooxygenase [Pyrinomonadaceae bacterium]